MLKFYYFLCTQSVSKEHGVARLFSTTWNMDFQQRVQQPVEYFDSKIQIYKLPVVGLLIAGNVCMNIARRTKNYRTSDCQANNSRQSDSTSCNG
jgi:hypothetical protein